MIEITFKKLVQVITLQKIKDEKIEHEKNHKKIKFPPITKDDFFKKENQTKKELKILLQRLNKNDNHLYNVSRIPKQNITSKNNFRAIQKPKYELKYVQRVILKYCLNKIPLPQNFYGGIINKDYVKNAKYHTGNLYFLQTDFKDFFDTISYTLILKALKNEGIKDEVAKLITRICTKNYKLVQGSPTSPFLSALVLKHEFSKTFNLLKKQEFKVSVYVDDITISSKIDFKHKKSELLKLLRHKDIKINTNKTIYSKTSCEITGVLLTYNTLSPGTNLKNNLNHFRSVDSHLGCIIAEEYIEKISNTIKL